MLRHENKSRASTCMLHISNRPASHFIQSQHCFPEHTHYTSGNISSLHPLFSPSHVQHFNTHFCFYTSTLAAHCSTSRDGEKTCEGTWAPSFLSEFVSSPLLIFFPFSSLFFPPLLLKTFSESHATAGALSAKQRWKVKPLDVLLKLTTMRWKGLGFSFKGEGHRSCFASLNLSRMVFCRRSTVHCVQRASVSQQHKATGSRAP